jgi:DNA-binding CsgD family transcriptional regulator
VTATLTVREREIAQQLVAGATSKQIARALAISPRTVEAHRARLLKKFGASSIGELVARLVGGG